MNCRAPKVLSFSKRAGRPAAHTHRKPGSGQRIRTPAQDRYARSFSKRVASPSAVPAVAEMERFELSCPLTGCGRVPACWATNCPSFPNLYGRERRNRTPILSERWYSRPVADLPPAPSVLNFQRSFGGPRETRTLTPKDWYLKPARLPITPEGHMDHAAGIEPATAALQAALLPFELAWKL